MADFVEADKYDACCQPLPASPPHVPSRRLPKKKKKKKKETMKMQTNPLLTVLNHGGVRAELRGGYPDGLDPMFVVASS
jgi:hypothetical protein